ncbi:hypothetical protein CMV_021626 [Castanea mollissima]|uniref:CCHC-type domain-containing protein n=1 Tax=Castanea mollissima TaxID=60419 RepID=A0A8J4VEW8_9ROSI|nr:hypothetical protein CMV_021626 [Castanea mollissima]
MDCEVVSSLEKFKLTKEEEEDIVIANSSSSEIFEECSLSLFGRLLSDRHQNLRALKNTLKAAWKIGSDLRIVEVGNNVIQFKFSSSYQLEWVEKNGPWNFENNLLLLCQWRKGLTSKNICFSHSPFWVQIWGLPFENMAEEIGKNIGSKIGRVLEVDKRAMQAGQAKFLRIRVEVPIDKPLRRGGYVKNEEGGRYWVDFRYERLPVFCYICGVLGHDEKHCPLKPMEQYAERQYGEWLKAGGVFKNGGEKEKVKEKPVAEKESSSSLMEGGEAGEEVGAVRESLPSMVVSDGAGEEAGTEMMMDAAPMGTVRGLVMSNQRGQEEQISRGNSGAEISKVGLDQMAREEQVCFRTGLVKNEAEGNQVVQIEVDNSVGPVISEFKGSSPIN